MNIFFEKMGSYQILTNLLPGTFFILLFRYFFASTLPTQNIGEDIAVYYFTGLIINRIGSLIVEPILKKLDFIKYAPYPDFVKAVKIDSKIDTLSEMNNYTRSLLTCLLLLPALRILNVIPINWKWPLIAFLIVLFLFAYRKQTAYIRKRVEAVNNLHEK